MDENVIRTAAECVGGTDWTVIVNNVAGAVVFSVVSVCVAWVWWAWLKYRKPIPFM